MEKIIYYCLCLIVVGIICMFIPLVFKKIKVNTPLIGTFIGGLGMSTLSTYGVYKLIIKLIEVIKR